MSAKQVRNLSRCIVMSPARRTWFTNQEAPSASFGAGMLLEANTVLSVRDRTPCGDGMGWKSIAGTATAGRDGLWNLGEDR